MNPHPENTPPDRTDREAQLRRIAHITCPQDRGESPFAWSDLPTPTPTPDPTTNTPRSTP